MGILQSLIQVTVVGIILGAGLPVLFALGVKLGVPEGASATGSLPGWRRGLAWVFFGVVIIAIIAGLLWITQGRIYSTFGWDVFGTAASSDRKSVV